MTDKNHLGNKIKLAMGNFCKALLCTACFVAFAGYARAQVPPPSPDGSQTEWKKYSGKIDSIDPGEYEIIFREVGTGCLSDTETFEIKLLEQPAAPLVSGISQPTCMLSTGSVVLTGLPEDNWTINPGNITGSGPTATIKDLTAGQSYAFTVTTSNGCTSEPSVLVPINPAPLTPEPPTAEAQSFCAGSTVSVLEADYPAGTELRWYSSKDGNTPPLDKDNALITGTYYAAAVSTDDCESTRVGVEVTVNQFVLPVVSISASKSEICQGNEVSFTATPINGGTNPTYEWFIGDVKQEGFTSNEFTAYNQTQNFTVRVIMTSNATCRSVDADSDEQSIQVNAMPILMVTHSECSPDRKSYTVYFDTDGQITTNFGVVDNANKTVSNIPKGQTVTLKATNEAGCQTVKEYVSPDCNCPIITVPDSPEDKTICRGDAFPEFSVSLAEGLLANWYNEQDELIRENIVTFTPNEAGTYYVKAYDPVSGCESAPSATFSIIVHELPPPPTAEAQTFCAGSHVSDLEAEYTAGTELRWYASMESDTPFAPSTELKSDTYYAAAFSADSCESARTEVQVTVTPLLTLTVNGTTDKLCKNTTQLISALVTGGSGDYSYLWEGVGTELLFVLGTNTQSTAWLTANYLPSGLYSYRVTVTDNETLCSVSEEFRVEILYDFNMNFKKFTSNVAEGQSGVVYELFALEGATYVWSVDGCESFSGQDSSQIKVNWAQPGTFTVKASMQIGDDCTQEYTRRVTVHPLPIPYLGENPAVCPGSDFAELSYSEITQNPVKYSIIFDNEAVQAGFVNVVNADLPVSPFIIPLPENLLPGTYKGELSVTSLFPTRNSLPYAIEVTVTPAVMLKAIVVQNESYPGAKQGRVYIETLSGGTGRLDVYLNNELLEGYAQGSTLKLDPGEYNLQARDSKGCNSGEFQFTINENSELSFSAEPLQPETCDGTAPVQLVFYNNPDISSYEYCIDGGNWFPLPGNAIIPKMRGGQHDIALRDGAFYFPSTINVLVSSVLNPISFNLDKEIIECEPSGTILVQNLEWRDGTYKYMLASDQEVLSGVVSIMGKEYPWVKIGSQYWMAADLAYTDGEDDIITGQAQFGGMYYTHYAAMRIAGQIEGWRLPTLEETALLSEFAGGDLNAGSKLKGLNLWNASNTVASNQFDFNALPAGEILSDGYSGMGSEYYFWTEDTISSNNETLAVARKLSSNNATFEVNYGEKTYARSVRLIKDDLTELEYRGEWKDLDPTGRIPGKSTGTYNVVVSAGQVCKPLEKSISLEIIPPVVFDEPIKENVLCYNDKSGSITLGEVSGGSGLGYKYRLNEGSWETYTPGEKISGLVFRADGHLLEVSDSRDCNANPFRFDIEQPNEIIINWNYTANLSYEGTSNGEIEILTISGGNTIKGIEINNTYYDYYPGMSVANLPIGTNSLVALDNEECQSREYEVNIGQIDSVRFEISKQILPCNVEGNIVLRNITGGISREGMEYNLNNEGWTLLSPDNSIPPLSAGSYTIKLRDKDGNQSTLHTFDIVTYIPISFTVTDKTNQCDYPGTIEISNIDGGNKKYFCAISAEPDPVFDQLSWIEANPLSQTISSTYANVFVWVKDGNGCISNSSYIELNLKDPITVDVSNKRSFIYYGGNYEIMSFNAITGGYGIPYTYSLDGGQNWNEFKDAIIANYLPFGTYHFVAKDKQGCTSEPITFTVSQFTELKLTAKFVKNATCYNGEDGKILIEKIEGGTEVGYYFRINGGPRVYWNEAYTQELSAGEYRIIAYDSFDQESDELVLHVGEANPIQIEYLEPEMICFGSRNGSITISKVTGDAENYTHYLDGEIIQGLTDNGGIITGLSAGKHVYKVKDGNGCYSGEKNIEILQYNDIVLNASSLGTVACNGDQTVQMVVNSITGRENGCTLYVNSEAFQGPFANGQQLDHPFGAGSYNLEVVDENQCRSNNINITIDQPDALMAYFSKKKDVACFDEENGIVQINNVSGGTPARKLLINNEEYPENVVSGMEISLAAGNYIFQIRDINNCLSPLSENIKVLQPTPISFSTEVENHVSCKGLSDGRIKITNVSGGRIDGNALVYEVSTDRVKWNVLDFENPVIDGLQAGDYQIWLKANNCISEAQNETILEGNVVSLVNPQSIDVTCYESNNGGIKIDAIEGTVDDRKYWYRLFDNDFKSCEKNGFVIKGFSAGIYSLEVKDSLGCNTTMEFTINNNYKINFEVSGTTSTVCNPNTPSGTLTLSGVRGGDTQTYFYRIGSGQPEVLAPDKIIKNLGSGLNQEITIANNNCSSEPRFFNINATENLAIEHEEQNIRCYGEGNGKVLINSVVGSRSDITYMYKIDGHEGWTNFEKSTDIGIIEPIKDATIFVQSEDACAQGSFIFSISEPSPLTIGKINYLPNCNGEPAQSFHQKLEIKSVSGGNGKYKYKFDNVSPYSFVPYTPGKVHDEFRSDLDLTLTVRDTLGCEASVNDIKIRKTEILRFVHESFDAPCVNGKGYDLVQNITGGSQSGIQYRVFNEEGDVSNGFTSLPGNRVIYDIPYGLNHIQLKDDANCVSDIQSFVIEDNGEFNVDFDKFIPLPCDGLNPSFSILMVDGRDNKKFRYKVNNGPISDELPLPIQVEGLVPGQLNSVVLVDGESGCKVVVDEFFIPEPFEPFSFVERTLSEPHCIDDLVTLTVKKLNRWTSAFNEHNELQVNINRQAVVDPATGEMTGYSWIDYGNNEERTFDLIQGDNIITIKDSIVIEPGKPKQACITEFTIQAPEINPLTVNYTYGNNICTDDFPHVSINSVSGGSSNNYRYKLNDNDRVAISDSCKVPLEEGDNTLLIDDGYECNKIVYQFNNVKRNNILEEITSKNLTITPFSCREDVLFATVEINYPLKNTNQIDQLFIEFTKEETSGTETKYLPYGKKQMLQAGSHSVDEPGSPELSQNHPIFDFESDGIYHAIISNQNGCKKSVQFTIDMFRKITFDVEQIDTLCSDEEAQIKIINLDGGVGNNGYQYAFDSESSEWKDLVLNSNDNYIIEGKPGVYNNFSIRAKSEEGKDYNCLTAVKKLEVKKIEPVKILYAYRNVPCNNNIRSLLFGVAGDGLNLDDLQFCTDIKPWRPLSGIVDVSHFTGSIYMYVSTKQNPDEFIWEIPISNLKIINEIRLGSAVGMINFIPNQSDQGSGYSIEINKADAVPFEIAGHLFKTDDPKTLFNEEVNTFSIYPNACSDTKATGSFNIKSSPKPEFTLKATYPTVNEPKGSLTVSGAKGGSGQGYQYTRKGIYGWEELAPDSVTVSNLDIGVYWVKIKDGFGCESDIQTVDINYQPSLDLVVTEISCRNQEDASITANFVLVDNENTSTIKWFYKNSDGAWVLMENEVNNLIKNKGPGEYRAVLTEYFPDGKEKTIEGSVKITNPDEFSHGVTVTNVSCTESKNGVVELHVLGGTQPYRYRLTNSEDYSNNNRFDSLAPDTYSFEVKDTNDCEYSIKEIVVDEPDAALAFSSSQQSPSRFNAADGTLSITLTGGWANYSLELRDKLSLLITADIVGNSDNNFTYSFSGLSAGTYSLLIYDYPHADKTGEVCSLTKSITINNPPILQVESINVIEPTCHNEGKGQITIRAKGGVIIPGNTELYNYKWQYIVDNNPITLSVTGKTATGLAAGDYVITITDEAGSAISVSYNLPKPRQFNVTAQKSDISCKGYLSGSVSVSYNHRYGDLLTIDGMEMVNMRYDKLAAGSHLIRVEDANGCAEELNVEIFEPDQKLEATVKTTNPSVGANNGIVSLNISGGVSPYFVELLAIDANNIESLVLSEPVDGTEHTFNQLPVGKYMVRVSDRYNLANEIPPCVVETDASLYPRNALSGKIITLTDYTCNQTGTFEAVPLGGDPDQEYSFKWTLGNTQNSIGSGNTIQINQPAVYNVLITNGEGNTMLSWSGSIEIKPLIEPVMVKNADCYGENNGAIQLVINNLAEPCSFLWSNGAVTQNIDNLGAGNYVVTVNDALGCSSSSSFTIAQPDKPIEINVNNNSIVFPSSASAINGRISLTQTRDISGGWGNYTYEWRNSNKQIIGTKLNISKLGVGSYFLTVHSSERKTGAVCSETKEFVLYPNGLFIDISVKGDFKCYDTPNLGLEANVISNGYKKNQLNYTWYNANNQVKGNNEKLKNIPQGTYTLVITNKKGVELGRKSIILEDPNLFKINPVATNASNQNANNGSILTNASGGQLPYSFVWNDGLTNANRFNLPSGTYSVTATDAYGCKLYPKPIVISADPLAVEIEKVRGLVCQEHSNGILKANAHGGDPLNGNQYSFQWQKSFDGVWSNIENGNSQTLSACASGSYKVLVTDNDGNSVMGEFNLIAQSNIEVTIDITNANCSGELGSALAEITGAAGNYSCIWSNGGKTSSIDNLQGGFYSLIVTDELGCSQSKSISVLQSGELSYNAVITPDQCLSSPDGAIGISNLQGSGNYTYSWSKVDDNGLVSKIENSNSERLENMVAGKYLLVVNDLGQHSHCSLRKLFTIEHLPLMENWFNNIPETVNMCFDNSISILNVPLENQPEARYQWLLNGNEVSSDPLYEIPDAGIYTLKVSDQTSCVWEKEIQVEKSPFELHAEFLLPSVSMPGVEVNIVNTSLTINDENKPDRVEWTYPVNATVEEENDQSLVLKFDETGEYIIELKLEKDNCEKIYKKSIIITEDIPQDQAQGNYTEPLIIEFKASPNPASNYYNVEIEFSRNSQAWLFVHDYVTAQQISSEFLGEISGDKQWTKNYNATNMHRGFYLLTLVTPAERRTLKINIIPE